MSLYRQSIIEAQQFTPDILAKFAGLTDQYCEAIARDNRYADPALSGVRACLAFHEPSTRTRFSFEAAILNLGGQCVSSDNAGEFSSAAKGESLGHSVRVMSAYGDMIILRHSHDNAAAEARDYLESMKVRALIINAGSGMGQHPTQSLVDWYTVRKLKGRTSNLHIVVAGDLARGRTARSFTYLFGREEGVHLHFASPLQLTMGRDLLAYLNRHGVAYTEHQSLDGIIETADIVYVTRIQKERKLNGLDISAINTEPFRVTAERAQRMKKDALLMHPMPIVDEIEMGVERLPQSVFFQQSDFGVPVRMALLKMVMRA